MRIGFCQFNKDNKSENAFKHLKNPPKSKIEFEGKRCCLKEF